MADATATFAVELEDGVSGSAQSAEAALEELRAKIIQDTAALRQMEAAMRQMQKSGTASAGAMSQLRDKIDAQKASLGQAQSKYVSMGGTFQKISSGARGATQAQGGLLDATNALGGSTGELAGKFKALKAAGMAGAAVAAAAVFVLLSAAIVATVVKLTAFAIKAADAARNVGLLRQAATGSAAGAKELGAAVDRVAKKAALSREAIGGIGIELARAKLAGANLENAMAAISVVSATMGDSAGSKLKSTILEATKEGKFALKDMQSAFEGAGVSLSDVTGALSNNLGISMQEASARLKDGKVSLEQGMAAIAAAVDSKLGAVGKGQLLGLDSQMQRARENFGKLFSDIEIEPFLKALDSVLSLLDEGSSSGQALKAIMTTMLQPIINGLAAAAPLAKGFFKGMVIAALLVAIGVMKVKNAIKSAFGGDTFEGLDLMKVGVYAGVAAVSVLVGGVIALTVAMGALAAIIAFPFVLVGSAIAAVIAVVAVLAAGFLAVPAAIAAVGVALYAGVAALVAFASNAISAGKGFVDGLINGIKAGAKALVSAVSGLAGEALSAFKAKFAISSPSRVMMKMGGHITEGLAEGIDDGAPDAERAMQGLVSIPTEAAAKEAPDGKGAARGGNVTVNINKIDVSTDAEGKFDKQKFREMLVAEFELVLRQSGMVPA